MPRQRRLLVKVRLERTALPDCHEQVPGELILELFLEVLPRRWHFHDFDVSGRTRDIPHGQTPWNARMYRMQTKWKRAAEEGKVGWLLLWLLGVPIPILLILFLVRGCT